MLEALRKAAGTWVAKLLLALLIVSFAIWGISGQMIEGLGSRSVIEAGGTSVSQTDYRLAYDRQIQVLSQQFGTRLTREQARALGVEQQVLAQLIAGAVLDEQARQMGLGVSKDKLAQLAVEDPAFRGSGGTFDRRLFEAILRQVGMTPEEYLRNREQVAIRQQIVEAATDGLKAPDTFLEALALYRGEDRTVEFVSLPASLVEPIEDPDPATLQAWFDDRKANYTAPEYRKISYVLLDPEALADVSTISDEQVRKDYDQRIANYTTPEQRTIEQLNFPDEEAARTAFESTRTGATFEDLVTAAGRTMADVQLGTFAKEQVPDPAVAEAAFALPINQVSEVVNGAFGPVLLRVTEIKPQVVTPFEQVKEEIRKELAVAEASRILLDAHDTYEDSRAAGDTLAEAAGKLNLEVVTVEAVDRNGTGPDGSAVELPEPAALLQEAFNSEVGIENPAINLARGGFLYYEIEGITPARDRTLDEVRERVLADWKAAETESRLEAKAAEYEKKLKDGTALDQIASELGLEKQVKRGVKRGSDDADFGREGVATVFGVAEGGSGLVNASGGGARLLFKVTEVFEPAGAGPDTIPEEERRQVAVTFSNDLLDQLVAGLQSQYDVTINRGAIDQALAF